MTLTRAQAARETVARETARRSLLNFCRYLHPNWIEGRHIVTLCEHLEAVERGDIRRLVIEMPPRHCKSEAASRMFPAWFLGRNPRRGVMSAAYNQSLAVDEYGRKVRGYVRSPDYQCVFPGVELAPDSKAAGRWNTNHGGTYIAAGVDAGIAGRGVDISVDDTCDFALIIDDPIRKDKDVQSETMRQHLWEWYEGEAHSRLTARSAVILIGTRRHEEDLTGMALERHKNENWVRLTMPAIAHEGTDHEEALWPEVHPLDHLQKRRASILPRIWHALYQQDPRPDEGDFLKMAWFGRRWEKLPEVHKYLASDFAVTAPTDGKDPDYTEHGLFGVDGQDDLYVADWWGERTTSNVWVDAALDLIEKHQPFCWFVEGGVIWSAVRPMVEQRMKERHVYCRIEVINPVHKKDVRGQSLQARAAMKKIILPKDEEQRPWVKRVLASWVGFPNVRYDDPFDCAATMCLAIDQAHGAFIRPEEKEPKRKAYQRHRPIRRNRYRTV